jgi:hypothetical protein
MSPALEPVAEAPLALEVGLLFIVDRIGPRSAGPSLSGL